jgi:hypothetical protein
MQNAKDSFYIALRDRLATLDPSRTMMIRANLRPAILVEDAEAPAPQVASDVFVLRWTETTLVQNLPLPLVGMTVEVEYASAGSEGNLGLDRGRDLSAMDSLLRAMVVPASTQKYTYAQTPSVAMQTQVFWTQPTFGATETARDRLIRTAKMTIFSFEEVGE